MLVSGGQGASSALKTPVLQQPQGSIWQTVTEPYNMHIYDKCILEVIGAVPHLILRLIVRVPR